jgi:hypothetical protein
VFIALRSAERGDEMAGVDRNEPCPCGSGRKYKKCCRPDPTKPREQYVYIGADRPFDGTAWGQQGKVSVHFPSGDQRETNAVFSLRQYLKDSGKPKVLWATHGTALVDPHELFQSHDVVYAIDTNTRDVQGALVSVCSFLECHRRAGDFFLGSMIFRDCECPERYGWARLMAMLTSHTSYRQTLSIALITDHDLSRHHQYNTRAVPIYEELHLPVGFDLVYATSDNRAESILNRLIAECDREAGDLLSSLATSGVLSAYGRSMTLDQVAAPSPIADDPLFAHLLPRDTL